MDTTRYDGDELNEFDDVLDHSYFAEDQDEETERKTPTIREDDYFRRISDL